MAGPTMIAVNTYQKVTRDSQLARFQMFSAYTSPSSIEYFNRAVAPEDSPLVPYNRDMSNAAWGLIKQIFVQTEQFAEVRSLNALNAYAVFSLESLAQVIKLSKANTKVTPYAAQNYVWALVKEFQDIYRSGKSREEITRIIFSNHYTSHPNAHEIRALLAPDSICNMHFMKRFPDKHSTQTNFFRYHCVRAFQEMVMNGSNFLMRLESSFADPMVTCLVIDALERLCVAPLVAADTQAVLWFVGTHYCTSSTRTPAVDQDMKLLLCSYGMPFTEDWDQYELEQKNKALEKESEAQEDAHVAENQDGQDKEDEASQEIKSAEVQKELPPNDPKVDTKSTEGASE